MTSDTFASKLYGDVFAGGDPDRQRAVKIATGETIKPGFAIYITAEQAYAAKNSDKRISGIAALKDGQDPDTAYTAGDLIEWYAIGQKTEVYAYYANVSPAVNLEPGDIMVLSSTDGMFSKFVYTDATDITDTLINKGGKCMETITGSTTDTKLFRLNLGA